jgi:hypothetical protein
MIAASLKAFFGSPEVSVQNTVDRRVDPRHKVLLRADLFPVLGYAEMTVKNVSRGGLAGETEAPLQTGQPLLFSLDGSHYHLGSVRWARGRRFGLSLEDALAIFGLENETDPGFLNDHQTRAKRHELDTIGRIAICSRRQACMVRDVSQSGFRLETSALLAERQQVLIKLKDRPLVLGAVQWCAAGMVGVKTVERMATLRLAYSYE